MPQSSDLIEIIKSGIDAVRPAAILPRLLQSLDYPELAEWLASPSRSLLCIGKAAVDCAKAVLSYVDCDQSFILATVGTESQGLSDVWHGSHPIPDEHSIQATEKLLQWIKSLPTESFLLVALSGGSSALLVSPASGLSFESKRAVNELLIRSGANIQEMNAVRKHLSKVKGGRLAASLGQRRSVVLVISDVIGDDLTTIGSGPFYPDQTTFLEAKQCLERYGIWEETPVDARQILQRGVEGKIAETPKEIVPAIPHYVVASNSVACQRSGARAAELGYRVDLDFHPVSGFVEDVAELLARRIIQLPPHTALIMGGEITVRVRGSGTGGRNQHLALLITELIARHDVLFGSVGTDGVDGNSPAAGAWTDGKTLQRAVQSGISYYEKVKAFDSYYFFESLGQSIKTGPTGTNVMDLYIALK